MKAAKFWAVFSQRKAIRLKRLILPTPCSMRARPLVEDFGKESRLCGGVLSVRDGGTDAAPACRLAVGLGVITLVAENRPRRDVRTDVEQDFEIAAIAGLTAGEVESQRQSVEIGLQVDFGGKPAARATESLAFLPPFAPAAETWARTIVESAI